MSIIFDGRSFAEGKLERLKVRVSDLKKRGITPKLASIIVGADPASILYVGLKKKAAEEIGAKVKIFHSLEVIEELNKDSSFHGIMIQMPLPKGMVNDKLQIINEIARQKDVDGLRDDSPYLHPTSMAVMQILEQVKDSVNLDPTPPICVVGAGGMVGRPLVRELKRQGYKVTECGSDTKDLKGKTLLADVLVSTAGVANLITEDMIKDGVILIDVGSPHGDIDKKAYSKARFVSPVPGGVGPVTISCLLENLISAC